MKTGRIFIGTSGWNYQHWSDGVFYPTGLKSKDWLRFYCQHFDTVEINSSFYRLPATKSFENWHDSVPNNFFFAVKANRFITHIKRLKECDQTVPRFLANASGLQEKMGPVLFQLPPSFHANEERLERFLDFWRDQKIVSAARAAFEFRHESWFDDKIMSLLERSGAAVCFADWQDLGNRFPLTANFVYVRRHGSQSLYSGSYTTKQLEGDADRVRQWAAHGKDVYVYFNNDAFGWAVKNALTLIEMLDGRSQDSKRDS